MGCDEAASPDEVTAWELDPDDKFDAVIDGVGKQSILPVALRHVKLAGLIALYGILDSSSLEVQHSLGPLNFRLQFHQWPIRENERGAQAQLCEWIRDGQLDPAAFISAEYPISDIAQGYQEAVARKYIKTIFRYPD